MPTFNETNTVEPLIIQALIESGWKYVKPEDLNRPFSSVMQEDLLKEALIKINPEIAEDVSRAEEVIRRLRTVIISSENHNLIRQNELFKEAIFEKNSYPFGEDGKSVDIKVFDFENLSNNSFIVTNQWEFPKPSVENGKRLDVVLLVNGIPLAIGEAKSVTRPDVSWITGAGDIRNYQLSIPKMFVPNVLVFSTEGKYFRYSAIGVPVEDWGPWHTSENKKEGTLADVKFSVQNMLTPSRVLDLMKFFTLYGTDRSNRKVKIIARYQQYEGANMIVERVKAGYPKKGLIWHFQGSGKSLLMIFAAQKLRTIPELKNPTVVVVDDRVDLESQITGDFNASSIPNLASANSREELESFFKADTRKILITTIFKFGEVQETLNSRENIVVMVDEAHRTQEGDLGSKMRLALPNAFFFGLTGTPINRADRNTFHTFGAEEDQNGYMSKYTFSDSLRDKATLPLRFEPGPLDWKIDERKIDEEFERLTKNLSDKEKKDLIGRVKMEALMTLPNRISEICNQIANHFKTKIEPNGFKAQVVVYDRDCCLKYHEELSHLLGEDAVTIVMDTNDDKGDKYKAWRRSKDEETKLLNRFKDPADPLKVVVVTSKLLTGFDCPVLQVMYLDKPMKDHTLLQAICRVNRKCGQSKDHGLIVDYVGIFDDVANALNYDDESIQKVITNINSVKDEFPQLLKKCLSYFDGVDRTVEGFEGLMAAQEKLKDPEVVLAFGADYRALSRAYEALSPDNFLQPFRADYIWLSRVYESVKPVDNRPSLIWAALGAKTIDLIHQNIQVETIRDDLDVLTLDADILDEYLNGKKDPAKKAREITVNIAARIRKHQNNEKFQKLGQRLEELREKHQQGLITSIEFLKMLLQLAKDTVQAEQEVDTHNEQEKAKAALTELFMSVKNVNTPKIVERIVNEIDDVVTKVRFVGWQDSIPGKQDVMKELRKIIWFKYKIKDQELFQKAYSYVEMYY